MSDLAAVVLLLAPDEPVDLPGSLGRAAHAIFLRLAREADPALAATLHADRLVKPFTAGFLDDGARQAQAVTRTAPARPLQLRITTLGEAPTRLLLETIVPELPATLEIDGVPVRVVGRALTGSEHPWAGQASFADLAETYLRPDAALSPRVRLRFRTPTTFRSQDRHIPLPLPALVFGSLLDRWNNVAPMRLDPHLHDWLATSLVIARYDLSTRLVQLGGGKQVGFLGQCAYTARDSEPSMVRQLGLLAASAFYSGIGHKTTMGMGMARAIESSQSKVPRG